MYERDGGISLDRVLNLVNVDGALIEEVVEDVVSLESLVPGLLVAKDQVYPLVKVGRYVVTFKCLDMSGGNTISLNIMQLVLSATQSFTGLVCQLFHYHNYHPHHQVHDPYLLHICCQIYAELAIRTRQGERSD